MRQVLRARRRRAAVAVEMAVVLPLLLMILFGVIEFGWAFTVRQAVVSAAREGARVASLPGSTETEINTRVAGFMHPLGLTTYNTTITRATSANPTEVVRVAIPYRDVTLVGGFFGSTAGNISATCSMRKEGLP
jgi:Flp pilus assembly protein TadG